MTGHDIVSMLEGRVECRCGTVVDTPEAHQRHWDAVIGREGIEAARAALAGKGDE